MTSGDLAAVTAVSAADAWAVGGTDSGKILLAHWNGSAWKQVPSPVSANGRLLGVTATSVRNAWAVGYTTTRTTVRSLILRWNGTTWKQVPSPSPGTDASLSGIAAISASNAWAVGGTDHPLILRWNGRAWKQMPGLNTVRGQLESISATSAGNAWAVGGRVTGTGFGSSFRTLILRWNGVTWKQVPSPKPAPHFSQSLDSVDAISARSAWAVGDGTDCGCGPGVPLILRWNGRAWKQVPGPRLGTDAFLAGVAAGTAHTAWVVGATGQGTSPTKTLILRWSGTAWKKVPSPSPGASAQLSGLALTSATNAWAVGTFSKVNHGHAKTLILRWNGRSWR